LAQAFSDLLKAKMRQRLNWLWLGFWRKVTTLFQFRVRVKSSDFMKNAGVDLHLTAADLAEIQAIIAR
jgi:hypothetical protein